MKVIEALRLINRMYDLDDRVLNGYVAFGAVAAGTVGVTNFSGGIDLVWDVWNEQFSVFGYGKAGATFPSAVGVGSGFALGLGFGRQPNVHAAWSGRFYEVGFSAGFKILKALDLSVSAAAFTSPGFGVVGLGWGVSGSASLPIRVPPLANVLWPSVSVNLSAGDWYPFDTLTRYGLVYPKVPLTKGYRTQEEAAIAVILGGERREDMGPYHVRHHMLSLAKGTTNVANTLKAVCPILKFGPLKIIPTYAWAVSVIKGAAWRLGWDVSAGNAPRIFVSLAKKFGLR